MSEAGEVLNFYELHAHIYISILRQRYTLLLSCSVALLLLDAFLRKQPSPLHTTMEPTMTTVATDTNISTTPLSSYLWSSEDDDELSPKVEVESTVFSFETAIENNTNLRQDVGCKGCIIKDLYEPGFQTSHPELCPRRGANIKLLVLITSASLNKNRRAAVRMTWGQFAMRQDIVMAFFMGRSIGKSKAIEKEDAIFGDIIVGSSIDSYSNLTLKSLSMLEWAMTYCPLAAKILKTDDDVFINIPRLMKFIAHQKRKEATKTLWGKMVQEGRTQRNPKSKYYVPKFQYENDTLPDFILGPAYLLTNDSIRPLFEAAPELPFLRLEDVFVTGILANKAGIKRMDAVDFFHIKVLDRCTIRRRRLVIHKLSINEQLNQWRKMLKDHFTPCNDQRKI